VKRILRLLAVAALMVAMLGASAMPAFADKGGDPRSEAGYGSYLKKRCQEAGGSYGKGKVDIEGQNAPFAGQTCLVQEGPPEE
jgi:hypothetical protein